MSPKAAIEIQEDFMTSFSIIKECTLCPRNCRAKRFAGELGYCQTGMDFNIASICIHHGEEPVISGKYGICNIFFTHCNLQCLFCQNYQISRNGIDHPEYQMELKEVLKQIEKILDNGIQSVGFVSPSHCIPQMKDIIRALKERGRKPIFVMNTNAYDKKEIIISLKESIDVYLPDLKYMDKNLAKSYSGAADYPKIAREALREMFRQRGAEIIVNAEGVIQSGLIIRHLVLPGQAENSKACLRFIAEELSPSVYISLMAQYCPPPAVSDHPELGRILSREEYDEIREEMERLGFQNGWFQDLDSLDYYLPDFHRTEIFPE